MGMNTTEAVGGDNSTIGTINLAHSLLRSRQIWLTRAFTPISAQDAELPRTLVDSVEVQIGPHIFADTRFHLIDEPPVTEALNTTMDSTLPPPVAFEFSDFPGELFCLPKDFSVDRKFSGKQHILAYFYAAPTQKVEKDPSVIKQDWYHYYSAERNLIRINVVIRSAGDNLIDVLLDYSDSHRTSVWREYRRSLCQPHPTARLSDDFIPGSFNNPNLPSRSQRSILIPSILAPQPPLDNARMNEKPGLENDALPKPNVEKSIGHARGGKVGYNFAVASASTSTKFYESDAESESDHESESIVEHVDNKPSATIKITFRSDRVDSNVNQKQTPRPESVTSSASKTKQATKKRPPLQPAVQGASSRPRRAAATSPDISSRACKYCGCNETPIWRRGPAGTGTLCNACGVKWKLGKILQ
ncbi:hypothetical protein GGI05_002159 [Coemansia sp. RSA 2603]|nr:hypothetical protein GGI05_002159 [Coemansia sp. RSA 2603]